MADPAKEKQLKIKLRSCTTLNKEMAMYVKEIEKWQGELDKLDEGKEPEQSEVKRCQDLRSESQNMLTDTRKRFQEYFGKLTQFLAENEDDDDLLESEQGKAALTFIKDNEDKAQ